MSDPTLPSFRYRLEVSYGAHPSGNSLIVKASPAPLCACNPVACANRIGTPANGHH